MKIVKKVLLLLILLPPFTLGAQELYVFSEPASNMPARSVSFKLTLRSPDSKYNSYFKQRYIPEIMIGINKNWMVHFTGGFSDYYSEKIQPESMRAYVKYRFLSNDDVHRHFRMAVFAEGSYSRYDHLYDEFTLDGDLSGIQTGLIATQLINRLAVSATAAYMRGFTETDGHSIHFEGPMLDMFNYSLSAGYLLLPRNYQSYKQTNLNLYLELLGSKGLGSPNMYLVDLAPAVQLIFNSTTKVNVGVKYQLKSNMVRVGERTYQFSIEHTILNAFKKK
jgi:hypothetical protein